MIVSNSSPLMYLAKIKRLKLLRELFKEVIVPEEVYEEVVLDGKEKGHLDASVVDQAIRDKWIVVRKMEIKEEIKRFASEIGAGEIAAINLAKQERVSLVLIDDASARTIAESFGLNVKGTLFVLLTAYKRKLLKKDEVINLANELVGLGFRISQEVYIDFIERLKG